MFLIEMAFKCLLCNIYKGSKARSTGNPQICSDCNPLFGIKNKRKRGSSK